MMLDSDLCGVYIRIVNMKMQEAMFVVLMLNTCISGCYCGEEQNTSEKVVVYE